MLFFLSEERGDQDELLQHKTKIFHMLNFEVFPRQWLLINFLDMLREMIGLSVCIHL